MPRWSGSMRSKWSAPRATAVCSGSSGEREATYRSTTDAGTTSSELAGDDDGGHGEALARRVGVRPGIGELVGCAAERARRAASSLSPSRSTSPRSAAGARATTPVSHGARSSEASHSARWPPARVADDDDAVGQVGVGVHRLDPGEHGGAGARPAAPRHPDAGVLEARDVEAVAGEGLGERATVGAVVLLAPEAAVDQRDGDAAGPVAPRGSHTS